MSLSSGLPMKRRFAVLFLTLAACSAPRPGFVDRITVEGTVSVRGAEPFTGVFLETPDRNSYVLRMDADARRGLDVPGRRRVTGVLTVDTWNGLRLAHLDVERIEIVPDR